MKRICLNLSAILLSASAAAAAPCATGTTSGPASEAAHTQLGKDATSNVDGGSKNKTTPGAKAESPGTVGAMQNTGANGTPEKGTKPLPEGMLITGGNSDGC